MQKSDFFFELPQELIAQIPLKSRERSRLLCLDKKTGVLAHNHFYELPDLLREGDCLILNDSRVLPARLIGKQGDGSSASSIEVVLLRDVSCEAGKTGDGSVGKTGDGSVSYSNGENKTQNRPLSYHLSYWECLTKPGKKTKPGAEIVFGDGELTATVKDVTDSGNRIIEFKYDGIFMEVLEKLGKMPLPPYIHEELKDAERYQTVYSKEAGSAAAPTAGLHFTKELLDKISSMGIDIHYVTLHVGLGTFRPVKTEDIKDHEMHAEFFIISDETAAAVNRVKERGGRVIAVGTTSCRVLESCSDDKGTVHAFSGFTDIFIYPGYNFKCINGLITNFHLPESTLIMLVSALAGRGNTLNAYNVAIKEKYRFFSFGDAMLIL